MSEKINLDVLSDDAKTLAGAWFGSMRPKSESTVTLHLQHNVPTERTQNALDELVAKGVISQRPFNRFGGVVYTPQVDCFDAFRWVGSLNKEWRERVNWKLMEAVR